MAKRTNRQHLEYIMVPSGDQALAAGSLSTTSTAVNLQNGQLGVMVATHDAAVSGLNYGDFLTAGQTTADVDAIKLVLGNAQSQDTTQADGWTIKPPFYEGPTIYADRVRSFSATISKTSTYAAEMYTGLATPADETAYNMYVELRSVRRDRDYGSSLDVLSPNYTTPDYTTLGTVSPVDDLLTNLIQRTNSMSSLIATTPAHRAKGNRPVIAFGINVAGGAGQALGTITCGTVINVQTTTYRGTTLTSTFTADVDFVQTVADWIAEGTVTAATTIEDVVVANAGTAATIDGMIVMGLNEGPSVVYDDIYATKTDVRLELSTFDPNDYTKSRVSDAFDGYGSGRQWRIRYDERAHGLRYNEQLAGHTDHFLQIDREIDETKDYNAFILDVFDYDVSLTKDQQSQKRIVILMEATSTCNTAGAATPVTIANAQPATVTSLNAILTPWLVSAKNHNSNFNVNGDTGVALPTTLFV